MQRKISKNYQVRTLTRLRRLAKLLKLDSAHVALFDACAKKSPQEGKS
jgi:hypothetical protein